MRKTSIGLICLLLALSMLGALVFGCSSPAPTTAPSPKPAASPAPAAKTIELRISTALTPKHGLTAYYMDPFATRVEAATNGRIKFKRYYSAELVAAGKEFDGLKGGLIDVAAPFLAAYHVGMFPLSDVPMLPVKNTEAVGASKAFAALVSSNAPIKDGKSFIQLEFGTRDLKVWPMLATAPYTISTNGKQFKTAADFKGTPIRAGSTIHNTLLKELGATAVSMPMPDCYQALSKGTLTGTVVHVSDWAGYGFAEVMRYTIEGISLGHYVSYLAVKNETWNSLPADIQKIWSDIAAEQQLKGAKDWQDEGAPQKQLNMTKGGVFQNFKDLDPSVQDAMSKAAVATWSTWISDMEKAGNPAKATAKLWADLIKAQGGVLLDGVDAALK